MKNVMFTLDVLSDEECECGSLVALEEYKNIPFDIKRVFYIFGVDKTIERGEHAHYDSNQVLISVSGSCEIKLDNGKEKRNFLLDSPNKALFQKKMVWGKMHNFSKDCVLLVLSDSLYEAKDYIRNYDKFMELTK